MIGTIKIDFTVIPDSDPTTILVGDKSYWGTAENQQSTLLITPPGSTVAIANIFAKHRLNIFNSVNLGMSCVTECADQQYVDLQDGVWTINLKSIYTGLEKTRYYLKTDRFQLELDKIYIRTGLEFDKNKKQFRDDLQDIEFLLRTAHAHTRNGDFYKADRDFTQAQNLLMKYSECKNCL